LRDELDVVIIEDGWTDVVWLFVELLFAIDDEALLVLAGVTVDVAVADGEHWKAMVVGRRTVLDGIDVPFDKRVAVGVRKGVMETESVPRVAEWVTVMGKVAERARAVRMYPGVNDSFEVWLGEMRWVESIDV
jgi:hypothetical protein